MIKVCFFHEDFDSDVSSGTIHSFSQWGTLFVSFDVKEIAIINESSTPNSELPIISSGIISNTYNSLKDFLAKSEQNISYSNAKGDVHYKHADYKNMDWMVIGSSGGNGFKGGVTIPTKDNRELYPRQAASILLSEALWHTH